MRAKDGQARYRLYGRNVASGFAFANRLAPATGSPDLSFECVEEAPFPGALERAEIAYAGPPGSADGKSGILVYRLDACWMVRFRTADFYLWPDRILCHLPDPEYRYLVEIQLLGVVLACWLELRGTPALHASAVSVGGRAAAFLSTAGGGKSSLAMTLMGAGHPMLTDDILSVERSGGDYLGHPGYPQVRMWPDQARLFLGSYDDLDIVHPAYSKRRVRVGEGGFGAFCAASTPLDCLYLPERHSPAEWGDQVEIVELSLREALMQLIGNSFVAPIVEALGLQSRRLEFFASLVREIPVRRLVYPEGFEHLPRVGQTIADDLSGPPLSGDEGR